MVASDSETAGGEDWFAGRYLVALAVALLGYSVLGRGFAYLGIPPLFIGEIAAIFGVAALVRARGLIPALTVPSNLALTALMAWTALRTIPYLHIYGMDALRDGVVVDYGAFALIVCGLIMADGRRVEVFVDSYVRFVKIFPVAGLAAYTLSRYFPDHLPILNSYGAAIAEIRPGEAAVHLAGVSVFALLGFCRLDKVRLTLIVVATIMVVSANRGAILAIGIPVVAAGLATRQIRQLALAVALGAMVLLSVLAIEESTLPYRPPDSSDDRPVRATQIVANLTGIFSNEPGSGEGTKEWREDWWRRIVNDTIDGPNFWTGRGFGVNLAEVADVGGWNPADIPPLRSPHNVTMTLLARGGVPELGLWALLLATWFGAIARGIRDARRKGRAQWHALFLFLGCYALAILIDASFDVALEGPMVGIWFWCLIGFGAGALAVYKRLPDERAAAAS